jgi:Patatin-like phospholipase
MEQVRLGLTISGAVSLGAYEGGALAALIVAAQALTDREEPPIRIDAIGGASAGSITGMLTARCLLDGLDPIHVMAEAWVRRGSLAAMRTSDPHAPLSIEALRRSAVELLDPPPDRRGRPQQRSPVVLHMALGCLRGLTYRMGRLEGPPIEASTFMDWGVFTLVSGMSVSGYTEPKDASVVDFALASGANAFGFPPKVLHRKTRPEDIALLEENEIINLPPDWSGSLWYTDGGTLDNEPLGRTFGIANEIDADGSGRRVHVLIHPHPDAVSTDTAWTLPEQRPSWTTTLQRCDRLQRSRGIYDDLRVAEKTNSRIMWAEHLRNAVTPLLEAHQEEWAPTLRQVWEMIAEQKTAIDRREPDSIQPSEEARSEALEEIEPDLSAVELFRRILAAATGLSGKHPARIEVISPNLLPEAKGARVEDLLGGEFLMHFGGFLDERLRWNDFELGYRSVQGWLACLEELGLEPADAALARDEVARRYEPRWKTGWGTRKLGSLPLGAKADVGRLSLHIGRVAIGEVVFGRR